MTRILALILVVGSSSPSLACSRAAPLQPVDPPNQEEIALRLAEAYEKVFVGRLMYKIPLTTTMEGDRYESGVVAVFAVSEGWNDYVEEPQKRIDWPYSTCGFADGLSTGEQYLVFHNPHRSRWYALPESGEMLKALGTPLYTVRRGFIRHMHN